MSIADALLSGDNLVIEGDNLRPLAELPDASFRLIYIDPPFNTGRVQSRQITSMTQSESGDRTGFQGRSYEIIWAYDYGARATKKWPAKHDRADVHVVLPVLDGNVKGMPMRVEISNDRRHGPVAIPVDDVARIAVLQQLRVVPFAHVRERRSASAHPFI